MNNGVAEINYNVSLPSGFYSLQALYTGTQNITFSKSVVGITVHPEDTRYIPKGKIAFNPVISEYGLNETFLLRLTDDEGFGLANQFVNISILDKANTAMWNIGLNTSNDGIIAFETQLLFLPGNYNLFVEFRNESYFVSRTFERALVIGKAKLFVSTNSLRTQYTDPFEYSGSVSNIQDYRFDNVLTYISLYWANNTPQGEELIPFEQIMQLTNGTIRVSGSKPIFLNGKLVVNVTIEESLLWSRRVFLFESYVSPELINITTEFSYYSTTFDKELIVNGRITEDEGSIPLSMTMNAWYSNSSGIFLIGKGLSDSNGNFVLTIQPSVLLPNASISYEISLNFSSVEGYQQLSPKSIYVFIENVLRLRPTTTLIQTTWGKNATVNFTTTDLFGTNQSGVYVIAQYSIQSGRSSQNITLAEGMSVSGSVNLELALNRSLFLPGNYPIKFIATHPEFSQPYLQQLTLEVAKAPNYLSISPSTTAFWSQSIILNSTLIEDSPQRPFIANAWIEYLIRLGGSSDWTLLGTSKTNEYGLSQFGYNVTNPKDQHLLSSGVYEIMVRFSGSPTYEESNATGILELQELETYLTLDYVFPRYNDGSTKLRISLKDQFDRPLANQLVTVLVDSIIPGVAYTSSEGVAIIDLNLYLNNEHLQAGNYSLQIQFLGEAGKYLPKNQINWLTIQPDLVDLRYSLDVGKDSVIFTLRTDDGAPISNYTVDFSVQLQTWITLLNATEIAYYIPAYAEAYARNQIKLKQDAFKLTSNGKPYAEYSIGFEVQYQEYLEQLFNVSLSTLNQNDVFQLEPFALIPNLSSVVFDALNRTITADSLFGVDEDSLSQLVFGVFSDDPDLQRKWIIGELMQDLGTVNGLYYIINYDFSSNSWKELFKNYYYIAVNWGNKYQLAEMFDQKWFDPETFQSIYDYSDSQYRYRAYDQFLSWKTKAIQSERYESYYNPPGSGGISTKRLYDFYFSHRWMMGIIDYYAQYAYSRPLVRRSDIEGELKSLLISIQNIAKEILDLSVLSQKAVLIQTLQDGIFDNVKNGFKTFLSLGITSQDYSLSTNASGQVEISMKNYVYDQLTSFLSNPENLVQYPSIQAVVDYLDFVESNYSVSMDELLTRVTSWFRSFGEFAFYFNLNKTGNFAGYVDEKFGYQTFKVSGKVARMYINPYYLNPETDVWDVEQEFFLPVSRDAIQNFAIVIPEVQELWLDVNKKQLVLNGYLEAKKNVGQKISIYQKVGASYLFLSDVFTGGQSSSVGGGNRDPSFIDVRSTRIPLRGGFFVLDDNPFINLRQRLISDISNSIQIDIFDGISYDSDLIDRGDSSSGGSGGGTVDPPLRPEPILVPASESSRLFNSMATLSVTSVDYAPIESELSNFTYSINLHELGVGTHEFMFVYVYQIPRTGNQIIIRKHISIIITSEVILDVNTSNSNDQFQINVRATDALGRPVQDLPVVAFIISSKLDGKTNSLGIATLYWKPPYAAEFSALVSSKPKEFYPISSTFSFVIEDKLVNTFAQLLKNSGSTISQAFENLTGLSIPQEVTEALNTLIGKTVEAGSLYLIQPLHLFTGFLDRWFIPSIGSDPSRISRISLELSKIPLLKFLEILGLENLNAFGFLEKRYIQITKENGIPVPWQDIPVLNNIVDSKGNIKISIMGIDLSAKIPSITIPIPFLTDEYGNPAKIIYDEGVVYTTRFENPIYKAITSLGGLRSLTDDGWLDLEIPDPLDTLFDNKKDGKITLEIKECWTDWLGNEWCIKTSVKVDSPLSIAGPGVIAKISIPDPLEVLLPFDFELNGYIDIQIPNPNLFAKIIQIIQPDFKIEYGGGYPSNSTFVNLLELFSSPNATHLNLEIPYLAVHETPLWTIERGGKMIGVGENEGAIMNVPAYIFKLFNIFMDRISGFVDGLIYDIIYPILRDAIVASLSRFSGSSASLSASLKTFAPLLTKGIIPEMFGKIKTVISNAREIPDPLETISKGLGIIEEIVPMDAIETVLNVMEPINSLLDAIGPLKNLIGVVIGGASNLFIDILMDILKEFIQAMINEFMETAMDDLFVSLNPVIGTLMNITSSLNNLFRFSNLPSLDLNAFDTLSSSETFSDLLLGSTRVTDAGVSTADLFLTVVSNIEEGLIGVIGLFLNNADILSKLLAPIISPIFGLLDQFTFLTGKTIPQSNTNNPDHLGKTIQLLAKNTQTQDQTLLLIVGFILKLLPDIVHSYIEQKVSQIESDTDDFLPSQGSSAYDRYQQKIESKLNDLIGDKKSMIYSWIDLSFFSISRIGVLLLKSQTFRNVVNSGFSLQNLNISIGNLTISLIKDLASGASNELFDISSIALVYSMIKNLLQQRLEYNTKIRRFSTSAELVAPDGWRIYSSEILEMINRKKNSAGLVEKILLNLVSDDIYTYYQNQFFLFSYTGNYLGPAMVAYIVASELKDIRKYAFLETIDLFLGLGIDLFSTAISGKNLYEIIKTRFWEVIDESSKNLGGIVTGFMSILFMIISIWKYQRTLLFFTILSSITLLFLESDRRMFEVASWSTLSHPDNPYGNIKTFSISELNKVGLAVTKILIRYANFEIAIAKGMASISFGPFQKLMSFLFDKEDKVASQQGKKIYMGYNYVASEIRISDVEKADQFDGRGAIDVVERMLFSFERFEFIVVVIQSLFDGIFFILNTVLL